VVKVIWHKAASPPHVDGSVVFARWRQFSPYIYRKPKAVSWQRPSRNRLRRHRIAWPQKPTPRIKQRVASYHTTKVIANNASYGKLCPKIGCHGNVPQHRWAPSYTWFLVPIWIQNLNSISIGLAVFTQMTAECVYILQWDAHSPPKNYPFPWGDLDLHLIHGSRAHPSPQPKRHLHRCSRFCRAH